jgi:hypothetical protein
MSESTRRRWRRLAVITAAGAAALGMIGLAQTGGATPEAARPRAQATPGQTEEAFVALAPVRVLDTRGPNNGPIGVPAAAPLRGGQEIDLPLTTPAPNRASAPVPPNASAVMINVTIDEDASLKSFLTVWPAGTPRPFTSANNAEPGLVSPNLTFAKLGPTGGVSFFAQQGAMNIAVDLVGYTVPLSAAGGVTGAAPLFVGTGPPAATVGVDGAVYLDTSTGQLFGPKAGGVWPTSPLPTPKPAAVAQGADDVALNLDAGAAGAFGTPVTVQTVAPLPGPADQLLDAVVVLQRNPPGSEDATVRCAWSTRPTRFFSTHLTALGTDAPSLHAVTLSVVGSATAGTGADLVCQASTAVAAIPGAVAVTAVQVNGQAVALSSNT